MFAKLEHRAIYSPFTLRRLRPQRGQAPERGDFGGGGGGGGGLATLPTTLPPLAGGSAREVSDLAVSLNVIGVEVGVQW